MERESLSHFVYFDTKQSGQGPSKPPVQPVTRDRKPKRRSDRCLALTSEAQKLDRALRTCAGLLDYIKRSADMEISGDEKKRADLRDAVRKRRGQKSEMCAHVTEKLVIQGGDETCSSSHL